MKNTAPISWQIINRAMKLFIWSRRKDISRI